MEIKPFFSVIIPSYNCANEIERLLDSIVAQELSKEDLEVIVCDDNSTDGCVELMKPYADKLNIKFFTTEPRDIHCPGNTRKDGLSHATGQWVTFIDNDDAFEPNVFKGVKDFILTNNCDSMVFTPFREFNPAQVGMIDRENHILTGYGKTFDGMTWLHGNFYNRQFLLDNKIDFKENLESHEDLYFNSMISSLLIGQGKTHAVYNQFVYKWIYRPNSLSRSYFSEEHYYIEVYLRDYLYSASEPWIQRYQQFPEHKDYYFAQTAFCFLYGYFYYQAALWKNGIERVLPENKPYLKDMLERILSVFKMTRTEFINWIMSQPREYHRVKQESFNGAGLFVEVESFKDFVYSL